MNRREFIKKSLEGIVIFCCICSIPLISGCKKNPVESEPESILNINSIIKDNIKYYVQTDKKIYSFGEEVEMMYKVTNLRDENVNFGFSSSKQYHFKVKTDHQIVWEMEMDGIPEQVPSYFTLQPNESKEFNEVWGLVKDLKYEIPIVIGNYQVIGELWVSDSNYYVPLSVPVEIIQ